MSVSKVNLIDVLHRPTARPAHDVPSPVRIDLQPGHQRYSGSRPLAVPTILERDHVLTMRDGVSLRADIYRPASGGPVPAIISWGPYGKSGSGFFNINKFPLRVGIPEAKLSGYENFEGLDPAEWVPRQYAIVNIDARGTGNSEGDLRFWGSGEGEDGCDSVEEIAKLPWCNGKVSMAGNSWLAICQWYTAAERPPHLACIAPLEAISDPLREFICRGGIPSPVFATLLGDSFFGRGRQEDMAAMLQKYPLDNEYWQDKRAKLGRIQIPTYILASYSTGLHAVGSFRAFEELGSSDKWLVVHATQEWYDLYSEERTRDLHLFFDRYLKDIDNGWEQTPRVRYSLLQFDKPSLVDQPFSDLPWNLPTSVSTRLFLSSDNKLSSTKSGRTDSVSYQADAPLKEISSEQDGLHFTHVFKKRTVLVGPATVVLHVASPDHNDLDIYVQLRKADKDGNILEYGNIPLGALGVTSIAEVPNTNPLKYLGPQGMLRASRRHISEALSAGSKSWKTLSHSRDEFIVPGEPVRLEIQLWPAGIVFESGQRMVLKVAGHSLTLNEFEVMPPFINCNKGPHIIYTGGDFDSSVQFNSV